MKRPTPVERQIRCMELMLQTLESYHAMPVRRAVRGTAWDRLAAIEWRIQAVAAAFEPDPESYLH